MEQSRVTMVGQFRNVLKLKFFSQTFAGHLKEVTNGEEDAQYFSSCVFVLHLQAFRSLQALRRRHLTPVPSY